MNTLLDLCEFIVDCEHKTAPTQEEGYPSIRTPNIGRGRLLLDGVNRVSEAIYEQWTKRAEPQSGDLILAREAPVGNVAVISDGLKCCLGQRTVLIRPDKNKTDPAYLCYLLVSNKMQALLLGKSSGATVHHLNMKDIRALEMPDMPDIQEQQRLGKIISAYDHLIENNQRRIKLLEESARLLYREWFVQLRFPGHERVKVNDGVPERWERKAISQMVDISPTTRAPKDELRPFVPMQSLSETSMVIGEIESRTVSGGAKFKNGDTLFARITPCLENGKTGFIQFLENDESVASGSTEFIVLRSRTVNPFWIYCLARDEDFRGHAIRSMVGSDGRQRVSPKCFDQYHALQPPKGVLDEFARIVQPNFEQVHQLAKQTVSLKQARDALLPKLMSGDLQV